MMAGPGTDRTELITSVRWLMADTALPVHWRFAAGQAIAGLRELVHSFDFLRLADGHTYTGIEPSFLVEVVDGLLAEPEGVVFASDRADLQRLRQSLAQRIEPAHRQGLAAGRKRWHEADRVFGSMPIEDLHRLAMRSAPDDEMLRGWFAEGFCFAYSLEEMESLRNESDGG
jgi:hypothetical protein